MDYFGETQAGHGLRLAAGPGLPAGPVVLVGDPADQPRPGRPAASTRRRPPTGANGSPSPLMAGHAGSCTRSCSRSEASIATSPSGPTTTRSAGASGSRRARCRGPSHARRRPTAPAKVADAGPHPDADAAAARVRRRERSPTRLESRDFSRPRRPPARVSGSSSTASLSPDCRPHLHSRYAQLRASQLRAEVLHVEPGARAVPLHGRRREHHQAGIRCVLGLGNRRDPAPHRHPDRGAARADPAVAAPLHPGPTEDAGPAAAHRARPRPTPNASFP